MAGSRVPHQGFNTKEAHAKWTGADAAASQGSAMSGLFRQFMSQQEKTMNNFMELMQKQDKERDGKDKKKEKEHKKDKKKDKEDPIAALEAQLYATQYFKSQQRHLKGTVDAKSKYLSHIKFSSESQEIAKLLGAKLQALATLSRKTSVTTKDVKELKSLESAISRLEQVLPEKIAEQLEKIEKKEIKVRADNWEDYKADFKDFTSNIGDMIKSLGEKIADKFMDFADSVGIGFLNVGNALRMVKTGGKILAGGYKALKWGVGAARSAINKGGEKVASSVGSMFSGKEESADKQETLLEEIVRLFRQFVSSNKNSGDARNKATESVMNRLKRMRKSSGGPGIIGGLMGKLGQGTKEIISDIGGFLKNNFGAILAAGLAGWAIGTWIYEHYEPEITKAVDATVAWISKAFDWVKEKVADFKAFVHKHMPWLDDKPPGSVPVAGAAAAQAGEATAAASAAAGAADTDVTKAARANFGGRNTRNIMRGGKGAASSTGGGELPSTDSWDFNPPGMDTSVPVGARGAKTGTLGNSSIRNMIDQFTQAGSNTDIEGMDPAARKNFLSMAKEYYESTGKKLKVNSAKRSYDQQAKLYALYKAGKGNPAAPPGKSLHEFGYALDLDTEAGNYLEKNNLLGKYGFERLKIPHEEHHIQVAGVTAAAAKAGIYSADDASQQGATTTGGGGVNGVAGGANMTKTAQGNTVPVQEGFKSVATSASQSDVRSYENSTGAGGGAAGVAAGVGVKDIPLFSSVDGSLLAMNVGAIVGG